MDTTCFVNNQQLQSVTWDNCHGGVGPFLFKDLIGNLAGDKKQFIKFIHDDLIPPGSTFGLHQHAGSEPMEEWYLCLSGHGVMLLNEEKIDMLPGDISVCYTNGYHGIENASKDEDLRILVIYAAAI